MFYSYIQIYTINKDIINPEGLETIKEWKILITPNEEYINQNINNFNLISTITNINIIDTFRIEFNKVYSIFTHARNKYLKAYIKNGTLTVIGDHQQVLLIQQLPVSYEIDTIDITLKANNNFLQNYGLPIF